MRRCADALGIKFIHNRFVGHVEGVREASFFCGVATTLIADKRSQTIHLLNLLAVRKSTDKVAFS